MCIIPIIMLKRFITYKVDENSDEEKAEEAPEAPEENNANTEEV